MAEQYISCTRCKCKYVNDDNHIKHDFGYNRLNVRFKTCIKCRDNKKQYMEDNKDKYKQYKHQYWIDNKEKITKQREQLIKDADESDGKIKYCNRCYANKSVDEFVCPNGKTYNACYRCLKARDEYNARTS